MTTNWRDLTYESDYLAPPQRSQRVRAAYDRYKTEHYTGEPGPDEVLIDFITDCLLLVEELEPGSAPDVAEFALRHFYGELSGRYALHDGWATLK